MLTPLFAQHHQQQHQCTTLHNRLLADAYEFSELPVRHNEDALNSELAQTLPWPVDEGDMGSAHAKTHLLLQVSTDYIAYNY
jgi:Sec63 Brl domain